MYLSVQVGKKTQPNMKRPSLLPLTLKNKPSPPNNPTNHGNKNKTKTPKTWRGKWEINLSSRSLTEHWKKRLPTIPSLEIEACGINTKRVKINILFCYLQSNGTKHLSNTGDTMTTNDQGEKVRSQTASLSQNL